MAKTVKNTEPKPAPKAEKRPPILYKPDIRFAFIAALAGLFLYANSIQNSYLLDDYAVITNNQYVQQGIKGIPKIFSSDIWHFENANLGYFRPLSLVTFAIENQFFPNNPHISHAGNVVLYGLTGFFLCLLLMRVFSNYPPAFSLLASLLFMAHPLHTEVVANIKSRDEILSFLNLLIATYMLLRALPNTKPKSLTDNLNYKWLIASFVFFYLALLSKESAMTGVLVIPVLFYFTNRFTIKQLATISAPFFILVLLFQFHKYEAIGTFSGDKLTGIIDYPYSNSGQSFPATFAVFAWCIKLMLLPYPLLYSYAYNQIPVTGWSSLNTITGLIIACALLFILVKQLNTKGPLLSGLLIFGVTLAPGLAFVLLKGGMFAERFLYAPVLGFSLAVSALLFNAFRSRFEGPNLKYFLSDMRLSIPLLLILGTYSVETIARNTDWKDALTLYNVDVEAAPDNAQAHLHYGMGLVETGIASHTPQVKADNFSTGIIQLNRALQITTNIPGAYYEKGRAYQFLDGNIDSAVLCYNEAIFWGSNYALGYFGLAGLYQQTGQQQLASYYYNKGIEIDPNNKEGAQARIAHQKATGLDVKNFPGLATVSQADLNDSTKDFAYYNNTGQMYGKKGDYVTAIKYLEKSAQLNPNNANTWLNLSVCYGMTKNNTKAIEVLNKVLDIDPNNTTALNNLYITYDLIGQKEKSAEYKARLTRLQGK